MKLTKNLIVASCFASIFSVNAGVVTRIDVSDKQIEKDKEFSITLQFANNANPVACGLQIDWGDGNIERFREALIKTGF